jgi:uncharacterized LabA/DUF88 family protein
MERGVTTEPRMTRPRRRRASATTTMETAPAETAVAPATEHSADAAEPTDVPVAAIASAPPAETPASETVAAGAAPARPRRRGGRRRAVSPERVTEAASEEPAAPSAPVEAGEPDGDTAVAILAVQSVQVEQELGEEVIAAPATPEELAEIARALGAEPEAESAQETGASKRRRRRRGRRGRGRSEGATPATGAGEPTASAASWTPILPSYPVEFEPAPPPTKRRPARRPGSTAVPRFSPEEQREIEAFVSPGNDAAGAAPAEAGKGDTAAEAKTRSRRRRGRNGAAPLEATTIETATPSLPASPALPPGATIEALLARQNVILDTLLERQIALLRNIERLLEQIDRHMSGAGGRTASMPRTGVFVDVPNVMYAAERLGWQIDFGKLLVMLTRGRELVRASAYAPVSDDPQMRLETQRFTQPFVGHGYRIVTKPLKRFADGSMKGNFDVEMAMDILTMADRLDIVCLVSGDGDFTRLVEMVQARGVRVEVASFAQSTSSELRAACDVFIDLTLYQKEIAA